MPGEAGLFSKISGVSRGLGTSSVITIRRRQEFQIKTGRSIVPKFDHWISAAVVCVLLFVGNITFASNRGIFDYAKQREAGKDTNKIVFIGDAGTHGARGNHEFMAGSILLARQLNSVYPQVHAVVRSSKNWPDDLTYADAIVVSLNHGKQAALDPQIFAAIRRGAGLMAIHFGVEVEKGEQGDNYLRWIGGYYEKLWSVNPWWTPHFKEFPDHPVTRGVKPFSVRDEWYYHMRFTPNMDGVTPILTDLPPLESVNQNASDGGGYPIVYKAVADGMPQHMAWAYDRRDGGRGFGFTGYHRHKNLGNDSFRTVLLNAVAWVAKLDIPKDGVASITPDRDQLEKAMDEARAAIKDGK